MAALTLLTSLSCAPTPMSAALVAGVDLTVGYDPREVHRAVIAEVQSAAQDGERLVVYAITARTLTDTIVLAETQLPEYPGIRRSARRDAIDEFSQQLLQALEARRDRSYLRASLISDFFELAAKYFDHHKVRTRDRRMLLITDGLQVDGSRNWESRSIETSGLHLPQIGGTVDFFGVRSDKNQGEKWKVVRHAWEQLLSAAGIKCGAYASSLPSAAVGG